MNLTYTSWGMVGIGPEASCLDVNQPGSVEAVPMTQVHMYGAWIIADHSTYINRYIEKYTSNRCYSLLPVPTTTTTTTTMAQPSSLPNKSRASSRTDAKPWSTGYASGSIALSSLNMLRSLHWQHSHLHLLLSTHNLNSHQMRSIRSSFSGLIPSNSPSSGHNTARMTKLTTKGMVVPYDEVSHSSVPKISRIRKEYD